jgi:hypothetical protein
MIRASELISFHDGKEPLAAAPALKDAIEANHQHNGLLWAQEDLARRKLAPDSEIAGNKRAIDLHNQKRNDAIERMDEELLKGLPQPASGARLNSETAGAMIDRLSILSLKIHNMRLQTQRTDVDAAHIEACQRRLQRLVEQRKDLAACLDRLLEEAQRGESYFKVYRQFKMYNDPKLNPAVYGEASRPTRS